MIAKTRPERLERGCTGPRIEHCEDHGLERAGEAAVGGEVTVEVRRHLFRSVAEYAAASGAQHEAPVALVAGQREEAAHPAAHRRAGLAEH